MRWGTFHYSSTTQLLLRSEKSFLQVVWRSVPKILDMSLISQMQLEYVGKSFLQMSTTTIAMNNFLDCRLNCNILHLNCLSIGKYQVRIFKRTLKVRFCRNNQFKVDWILNKEVWWRNTMCNLNKDDAFIKLLIVRASYFDFYYLCVTSMTDSNT